MAEMFDDAVVVIEVGDRARLWIGPPKKGGLRYGEVIGVDNLGHRGIQVRFDQPVSGQATCYATHAEVEVERRWNVRYADGTPSREVRADWFHEHAAKALTPPAPESATDPSACVEGGGES